jgi:hypothetical protein
MAHIVEGIVAVSTSPDTALTSAAADNIGGCTYHTSLGISFDRPAIRTKTVVVGE